jgi:hypothetical protein
MLAIMATIPEPKDIFVGELAQNGDWIVANIDTSIAWPVKAGKFKYRGTIDQQRACRPNVFRFCATEIPNVQRITACLLRNFDRLSPDCAAVFAEEQPMRRR